MHRGNVRTVAKEAQERVEKVVGETAVREAVIYEVIGKVKEFTTVVEG